MQPNEPLIGHLVKVFDLGRWNYVCQNHFLLPDILFIIAVHFLLDLSVFLRPRIGIDMVAHGRPAPRISSAPNLHLHGVRLSFYRHLCYNNYNK